MDALTAERFGPGVPQRELGTRPSSPPAHRDGRPDTRKKIAARRRVLVLALDGIDALNSGLST